MFMLRGYPVFKNGFLVIVLSFLACWQAYGFTPSFGAWKKSASRSKINILNYFNDGSGTTLYQFENDSTDRSGSFNGTPTGVTYLQGKFGRAAYLGDGRNIVIPKVFTNATAATFSFWVYPLTAADSITFLGFNVPSWTVAYQRGFGLHYNYVAQGYADGTVTANNTLHVYNAGNTNTDIAENLASTTITKNTWNHVVFVFSQPTMTIYVNGVSAGSVTNAAWTYLADWNTTNTNWVIGDTIYTSNASDTYFDQIRIFNRALTGAEALQLYSVP